MSNLRFQHQHTRNSHTTRVKVLANGRQALVARRGGVFGTMLLMVEKLVKDKQVKRSDFLAHLQEVSQSYSNGDLAQPLRQFAKANILTTVGRGAETRYRLNTGGLALWHKVCKNITWLNK